MPDPVDALVYYVVFIFSVTVHEAAHATAALIGGDSTAYEGGQVSLDLSLPPSTSSLRTLRWLASAKAQEPGDTQSRRSPSEPAGAESRRGGLPGQRLPDRTRPCWSAVNVGNG